MKAFPWLWPLSYNHWFMKHCLKVKVKLNRGGSLKVLVSRSWCLIMTKKKKEEVFSLEVHNLCFTLKAFFSLIVAALLLLVVLAMLCEFWLTCQESRRCGWQLTLTDLCVYCVKKESETRMTATVLAVLNKVQTHQRLKTTTKNTLFIRILC